MGLISRVLLLIATLQDLMLAATFPVWEDYRWFDVELC
jgi:hypothetical protein